MKACQQLSAINLADATHKRVRQLGGPLIYIKSTCGLLVILIWNWRYWDLSLSLSLRNTNPMCIDDDNQSILATLCTEWYSRKAQTIINMSSESKNKKPKTSIKTIMPKSESLTVWVCFLLNLKNGLNGKTDIESKFSIHYHTKTLQV